MNTINNRFLKNDCIFVRVSLYIDELSVHIDVFICSISRKNIKSEYCYAYWSTTIEFSQEMSNTRTSNYFF